MITKIAFSMLKSPRAPLQPQLVDAESSFYHSYLWCLNVFLTIRETVEHLRQEIDRLDETQEEWHRAERFTNVFLLSCSITDAVDDYLLGSGYDFSKAVAFMPLIRPVVRATEFFLTIPLKIRAARLAQLHEWKLRWAAEVEEFLRVFVAGGEPDRNTLSNSTARLASLLSTELPADLLAQRSKIPAAFRSQDLTHFDAITLGRKFVDAFPERRTPIVIAGLRTAGSYFAPLLSAYLKNEGYQEVDCVTIRPKKGAGMWESAHLARCAKRGGLAVLVDEPVDTGSTFAKGVDLLRQAGYARDDVVVLLPIHPSRRDWVSGDESLLLSDICILPLEPEEWHKQHLFEPEVVERRVAEYFLKRQYRSANVIATPTAELLNSQLQSLSEKKFHTRLKRIYEVRLQNPAGQFETRYILAKGVGWGWLSYHAFIAGDRLARFVPPMLGLRDGMLYTEWRPQAQFAAVVDGDREKLIRDTASYVAARVSSLGLRDDPSSDLSRRNLHKGYGILGDTLSGAYGWKVASVLRRHRVRRELSRQVCPVPTLIDGKMRHVEWIADAASFFKTDFEHHGLGKTELNITDPAYDLAEAMLYFGLSQSEETKLIERYLEECGDVSVSERLYINKLLAGIWAKKEAIDSISDPRLSHRHQEFNRQYLDGWNFLTMQTTRFCASFCKQPEALRWRSPLVVLDIDGVVDKQIFGYPSTTVSGIKAISLLHAHGFSVMANTARSIAETKAYCQAYGFVGGVADYGGIIWDALSGQERVLVSQESLDQLEVVRSALRKVPGAFLNDDYQYSIRAYTYERNTTVPLPKLLIHNLLSSLKVDRLRFRQTYTDTAILAKEIDKGKGLLALLALVGEEGLEALAVGDSEPDLAMFRVAKRCFAPSNITCRPLAKSLGCQITDRSYQPGLLSIVRSLVHEDRSQCDRCRSCDQLLPKNGHPFLDLLEVADQKLLTLLLRALLDPMNLQAFVT